MFELNRISDFDDVLICADTIVLQNIYGILNDLTDNKIPFVEFNHNKIVKISQGYAGFTSSDVSLTNDNYEFLF